MARMAKSIAKTAMQTGLIALAASVGMAVMAAPATAGEYTCKSDRVEKSGSTKYKVRRSGTDIYIEKSGSTRGKAVKRGSKYAVEVSGSTKATIEKGKIYKSGSTWAKVEDAQRIYECDPLVAATLWVLNEIGRLD